MNHHYRLIWNTKVNGWVPAAEIVKSRGKRSSGKTGATQNVSRRPRPFIGLSKIAISCALALGSHALIANPQGGQVVGGQASIVSTPDQVTVNQQTDKAIINWQSFSIGSGESTRFNQPSSGSITLNRITGQDPSRILGSLSANGQVWLVNPNGVYFGPNATIDVSGLLATTHDITNENFMAGNYQFNIAGRADASIVNDGNITINNAGLAAFVAPAVRNDGAILARFGQVELAAGTGFTLDLYGDRLVELAVDPQSVQAYTLDGEPLSSFVDNRGVIEAETVVMSANAARDVVDNVINMSGQITATTATQDGGRIILGGDTSHGDILVNGTLDASAVADSSGDGGEIIVYGDRTIIDSTAVLEAEAGLNGGDGGFIETSGDVISILDGVSISTLANEGSAGTWLIDPTDFYISSGSGSLSSSGIGASTLQDQLALGNVTIQTQSSGTEDGNIYINAPFGWIENTLSLISHNSIVFNAVVTMNFDIDGSAVLNMVTGSQGMVKMMRDADGYFVGKLDIAGDLAYQPNGILTINNNDYNILWSVNDIQNITSSGFYALAIDLDNIVSVGNGLFAKGASIGFSPLEINDLNGVFVFEGLGHQIDDLNIERVCEGPCIGDTGFLASLTGDINNLGVTGSVFSDYSSNVGGLVGLLDGGQIYNSYFRGTVEGTDYDLNASNIVGGLVGSSLNGTILESYFSADPNSLSSASYIVGGTIVGGLVGYNSGYIQDSYAEIGEIDAFQLSGQADAIYLGGLVGINTNLGTIIESFVTYDPNGLYFSDPQVYLSPDVNWADNQNSRVGGFVASNAGVIANSYAENIYIASGEILGLFAAQNSGSITNSLVDSVGNTGLSLLGNDFGSIVVSGNFVGANTGNISSSYVYVDWDGGSESNLWGTADNWSSNLFPDQYSQVFINANLDSIIVDNLSISLAAIDSRNLIDINNSQISILGSADFQQGLMADLSSYVSSDLLTITGDVSLGASSYLQANTMTITGNLSGAAGSYISGGSLDLDSTAGLGSSASPFQFDLNSLDYDVDGDVYILNNFASSPSLFNVWGSSTGTVSIINYGETIVPSGKSLVTNGGNLILTAKSPLTINGSVQANGNINLTASNPGNLTINGSVSSTGNGTINLNAPGGFVTGNIPAGAIVAQAGSGVVPAESLVTTTTTEETTTNETGLENEENTGSAGGNNLLEVFLLDPELEGLIYLDSLVDTLPPSGPSSGLPLPNVNELGLIEALLELYRKEYTPEDRYRFYESLTVQQVIDSLRLAKEDELADFFLALSETGARKESELMEILEKKGTSEEQKVAYLGVFVRMRQVALHKLLEPAIKILRQNPEIADIIREGKSGGGLKWDPARGVFTYIHEFQTDRYASASEGAQSSGDMAGGREVINNLVKTEDGVVRFEGQVQSESKLLNLRVNNQWAFIDENGNYRVKLPVKKGRSEVDLLVNDPSGDADKTVFTVDSQKDGELQLPKGRRIALMIGVEEYDNAIPELDTPVKDINDVAERLEKTQFFETRKLKNPTKQEVFDTLLQISAELGGEDTLMIYYAGHGYLMKENGRGYWLPRDASPASPENWISNRDISRIFHRTRSKQIMLVSDSCYSGAFIGARDRELLDDSYFFGKPRAVMGMSSGGETPVWDGGGNGNSIFAAKLLETLGQGEVAGKSLYAQLKNRVVQSSPQVPGYGAMLMPGYDDGGDFKLRQE